MKITKNQLLKRILEGEGLFQEFKTSLEKVDRTMVAFANTHGGIIYLGINDAGEQVSFKLTNRIKAEILNIARNCDPSLQAQIFDLGSFAAIWVPESEDKPHRCSDGFYIRIGATNQKLTRNEILELAVKVNQIRYETLQLLSFRFPEDFSEEAFENFVQQAQLDSILRTLGKEQLLITLGVAEKQQKKLLFNHAGVLFFAKNPQYFLPQAKISYARYQGTTQSEVIDRMLFSGTLPEQLQEVLNKLKFDIPVHYQLSRESGEGRKEIPIFPLRALEEALTNAIIHRDYSEVGSEIQIDYFSHCVTITNYGPLLGGLSVDKLGNKSIRRNPIIAELFFRIGRGEKLASGIPRMRALMQAWKLKEPVFETQGGFFSTTFIVPTHSILSPILESLRHKHLSERAQKFIEMRNRIHEPFSALEYASQFQSTVRTAQKDLELLVQHNLVRRDGKGKNTRYYFL